MLNVLNDPEVLRTNPHVDPGLMKSVRRMKEQLGAEAEAPKSAYRLQPPLGSPVQPMLLQTGGPRPRTNDAH
jgi:hypothetical protein